MTRYCPKFRGTMRRKAPEIGGIEVTPARCKSWLCDYCRAVNGKRLRHAVARSLEAMSPNLAYFTTITAYKWHRTPAKTYAALHRAWPIVRQWFRRHYGPFEYLAVYERHNDGAYHLHVVMFFVMLPYHPKLAARMQRQIKDAAPKWRIGYIADVRQIEGGAMGAVRYASKAVTRYLVKGNQSAKDALPKGARLFYLSRGIERVFDAGSAAGEWQRGDVISEQLALSLPVYALPLKRLLDDGDFEDSAYWPSDELRSSDGE